MPIRSLSSHTPKKKSLPRILFPQYNLCNMHAHPGFFFRGKGWMIFPPQKKYEKSQTVNALNLISHFP